MNAWDWRAAERWDRKAVVTAGRGARTPARLFRTGVPLCDSGCWLQGLRYLAQQHSRAEDTIRQSASPFPEIGCASSKFQTKDVRSLSQGRYRYGFKKACNFGHVHVVRKLLDLGDQGGALSLENPQALYNEAFYVHMAVMELLLLASGVDVNKGEHGSTPLCVAAGNGQRCSWRPKASM